MMASFSVAGLERADETQPVLPSQCRHCEQALTQRLEKAETTGRMYRHQIVEVPEIKAHVTEYQFHEVVCPQCGENIRAAVPPELRRQTGPQLTALVAYLTVVCRMPRRVVREFIEHALSIELSLGNTQTCWEEASGAVAAPCRELEQNPSREAVLNVDETGWRTNGGKRFLWAFVAARYFVRPAVPALAQVQKRTNRPAAALHPVHSGAKKFFALAEANLDNADRQVQNLALALFVNAGKLFTFLEHDGVEPTNNSAERALRTGVQWRKICFGNRSLDGELATARLLTDSQTCRLQRRNALQYLSQAISQYRRGLPVASLFKR